MDAVVQVLWEVLGRQGVSWIGFYLGPGQTLEDGRKVVVVGRGGGHGPPEKPPGISLVDARDGSTIWTLALEKFMSTMTVQVRKGRVHLFHGGEHLSVDVLTGKIAGRVSILKNVPVRRRIDGVRVTRTETISGKGRGRMITQSSNLLVGKYHYFRGYTTPYLGRVNVDDGAVEYLELPLQLSRAADGDDELHWYAPPPGKAPDKSKRRKGAKHPPLNMQGVLNEVKNARGLVVMGDKRSRGNGWGHVASPVPSVAGEHLYVPVMNGTVYVLRWNAPTLDEKAVAAINDLGPAGKSWTRASLSFADGHVYAHTIRELICVGKPFP